MVTAEAWREPQPSDGPEYHADHAYWRERNQPPSPANGEYREPMGEARDAGLQKRQQQRLANATYTATEVEALTRTATYLGKKLGRVEAAEQLIVAIEEAGWGEAAEVVRSYLLDCKEGES